MIMFLNFHQACILQIISHLKHDIVDVIFNKPILRIISHLKCDIVHVIFNKHILQIISGLKRDIFDVIFPSAGIPDLFFHRFTTESSCLPD